MFRLLLMLFLIFALTVWSVGCGLSKDEINAIGGGAIIGGVVLANAVDKDKKKDYFFFPPSTGTGTSTDTGTGTGTNTGTGTGTETGTGTGTATYTIICYSFDAEYATGSVDSEVYDKISGIMTTKYLSGVPGIRSWVKFDVSSIPETATVIEATVHWHIAVVRTPSPPSTNARLYYKDMDPEIASGESLYLDIAANLGDGLDFSTIGWKSCSITQNLYVIQDSIINGYAAMQFYFC